MSKWEKTFRLTQDTLARLCLLSGLGKLWNPSKRAGRSGWENRGLGLPPQAAAPLT